MECPCLKRRQILALPGEGASTLTISQREEGLQTGPPTAIPTAVLGSSAKGEMIVRTTEVDKKVT
jgi:hypothetical protein